MKDLIFFVCFIMIFLFAFSISCFSLIGTSNRVKWNYSPEGKLKDVQINQTKLHFQLIQDVMNFGIWKIFAQVDQIGLILLTLNSFFNSSFFSF